MAENRAIKYAAHLTKEQQILANKTFGCCRKIWNLMLDDKIKYYDETQQMLRNTPAMYKDKYPYLKEVDSLALCNVQLNLEQAYKNFFSNPKKFHFPKFKSKKYSRHSYTTNWVNGNIAIICNGKGQPYGIQLPKLGVVKTKLHRLPPENWKLKSATLSQDYDSRWYISVLFEYEPDKQNGSINKSSIFLRKIGTIPDKTIAFDYKSNGLYMDSNGELGSHDRFYRESEAKLAREQRRLSRKVSGSENYEKQRIKVAKIHKHIASQRKDFLHKKSTETANQYDIVIAEDLNMQLLANRDFHNGKSTYDNGYGMFLNMLEYKQADRGHVFIRIDKWYPSSQICSCCGARQKLPLSERVYSCPVCGTAIDRDYNAALNIKNEGLRILAQS